MSNFTPTTNPSPETSFFSRSVDVSQMADTTADNMRRSTVVSVPGNASHPSLSPRHVPPPVPRSQLSDSSQLSVQDLSLSHQPSIPPFDTNSVPVGSILQNNTANLENHVNNGDGVQFPNDDEVPDEVVENPPDDVSDGGGDMPERHYVTASSIFYNSGKDMSFIFSSTFGISSILSIDEDARFPLVCKKKGFKKSLVVPTPKWLKAEIIRRSKNGAMPRVPKPSGWNVKKCKD